MKELLDFIGQHESRGNYNVVWGGIKREDYPPRLLTEMTIGQVLAWQDKIDTKYMSEAAGRYQIMEDTLREIYAPAGFKLDDLFDHQNQDKLAAFLCKRRGYTRYMRGEISAEAFCNALAREWASLPLVSGDRKGKGYYDGDGLNKAANVVDEFLRIVKALRPADAPTPRPEKPGPLAGPTGIWALIIQLFNMLFARKK